MTTYIDEDPLPPIHAIVIEDAGAHPCSQARSQFPSGSPGHCPELSVLVKWANKHNMAWWQIQYSLGARPWSDPLPLPAKNLKLE